MKYKVAVLKNELESDHNVWLDSIGHCDQIKEVDVIDLLSDGWFEQINKKKYDILFLKPSGIFGHLKQLYDERVFIISSTFDSLIYPSVPELFLYENKRFLRDWLLSKGLPHPKSYVFYRKKEALNFLNSGVNFPLVAKTNIGASGNGVRVLNKISEALNYVDEGFGKGIHTNTGPRIRKGSLLKKIMKVLNNKGFFRSRIKQYIETLSTPQKGFVIFQEYVSHDFEWRCVRIGDSYFAHKKVVKNNMSSGSLIKDYSYVPLNLLDFIRNVTDTNNLTSVAIDLFESNGNYLINEIQCIFGQSDPYQMLVNGVPGRYRWISGRWIFEEGMFNTNFSYDLRVSHAISILGKIAR